MTSTLSSRLLFVVIILVVSPRRCHSVTLAPEDLGFPLVDSIQTIHSSFSDSDGVITDGGDLSTPKPPMDPSVFDYVFYMTDLSYLRQPWTEDGAFLPATLTYGLTFVIGLVGNTLVIFAMLFDKKWRSVTSTFLVSLAMADVVFLVVCVPYEMAIRLSSVWSGGLVLCKIAGFVEMLTASSSVLNLTAVSIERYAVIVHPIKSRTWCSTGRSHRIIAIVWIFAILLSSPLLRVMNTTEGLYYNQFDHVVIVTCADNSVNSEARIVFAWYQLIVMFLLPVFLMGFCYSFVIVVLWISTKELSRLTNYDSPSSDLSGARGRSSCSSQSQPPINTVGGSTAESRLSVQRNSSHRGGGGADIRDARKQVIKMLLTIIAVFFCCWGPKWVLNVMKRHQMSILHNNSAFYIMLIIHLLPYIQSCANPIIYSFMSNNFRRSLRNACLHRHRICSCCCCPCCSGNTRRRRRRQDDVAMTGGDVETTRYARNYFNSFASQNGARSTVSPAIANRRGVTCMSVVSEM